MKIMKIRTFLFTLDGYKPFSPDTYGNSAGSIEIFQIVMR